jgi:hypothetical protein
MHTSLAADRCGHGQDFNHLPEERSPVFLQFLDALFQIVSQFPNAFEFTDTLLLFLADHMHSCLFGNFLGTLRATISGHNKFSSLSIF